MDHKSQGKSSRYLERMFRYCYKIHISDILYLNTLVQNFQFVYETRPDFFNVHLDLGFET